MTPEGIERRPCRGARAPGAGRPATRSRIPWPRYGIVLAFGAALSLSVGAKGMEGAPAAGGPPEALPERTHFQDALPADTLVRDTIRPVSFMPDTVPPDSVRERLAPMTDTLLDPDVEVVRQVLPRNVADARGGVPSRPEAGIWEFDREALLATHAVTLHDLLSFVPGLVLVRGGDYGSPVAVTMLGLGAGQVRVFRDGVEDPPMEGGVVDLAQIGLAGFESVSVERRAGELRLHLRSLRIGDSTPYTYLDVGTGDLRTNIFRATFAHPDAFGGTLLVALDRMDTDGPFRTEPGATYGTSFRYSLFPRDGLGVALHYRSRTAQRAEGTFRPLEVNRTDLGVRAGWELTESLTLEAFGGRSTVEPGGRAEAGADTLLPADARGVAGVRISGDRGPVWARGEARIQSGGGWPSSVAGVEVGGHLPGLLGASVAFEREGWDEGSAGRSVSGRLWTEPRAGVSLFVDAQDARRGAPFLVPGRMPDEGDNGTGPDPGEGEGNGDPTGVGAMTGQGTELLRFGERRGVRAGARGLWRGVDLTAAALRIEADSLLPMGLPFDRGAAPMAGGIRNGAEISGRIPLTPIREGLGIAGHVQWWEAAPAWSYLPDRSWAGSLNWHHLGYDSNLEIWLDVGARGRDSMVVPGGEVGEPFGIASSSLAWFTRVQFRVVTVRMFVHWENFTLRDRLEDIPGRTLPPTRVIYGIRWTMWN